MKTNWPLKKTCLATALSLTMSGAQAIDWTYFTPPVDNNLNGGAPSSMIDFNLNAPPGMPPVDFAAFEALVLNKLPEGKDIRKSDPGMITDDLGANIYLVEDAQVQIAFLREGAGFRNSVGFFTFDPRNPPKTSSVFYDPATRGLYNQKILFPNFSAAGSGGALKAGNALDLGKFKAGTAIGFSIIANGWKPPVNPNQPATDIFYTLKGLNPEKPGTNNLNAHTVLLAKPDQSILALGFEDVNREGKSIAGFNSDHDFNDVVVVIRVTPDTAIDRSHILALDEKADTDGDGVPDALDAFPRDPERAYRRYFPDATGYAHLAFEDNWPNTGDYDMNDFVVDYRIIQSLNAFNQVVDVTLTYDIEARGAQFENGFGVHFPGVAASNVKTQKKDGTPATTISIAGATSVLKPEAGQSEAVFLLTNNINKLTPSGKPGCNFFNTENMALHRKDCPRQAPVRIEAKIEFETPVANLAAAPFNPFIFRTAKREVEIHLVDQPPTAKADPNWFGEGQDGSDPAAKRYYRTKDNKPWALNIPVDWAYPAEHQDISRAYPLFPTWVESGGISNPDWYTKPNTKFTY